MTSPLALWRDGLYLEALHAYRAELDGRGERFTLGRARGFFGRCMTNREWAELVACYTP